MSRDLTTDTENALAAGHVRFLVFVEMDFSSGMLRVNNSAINLDWNGYSWLGVGRLGGVDPVREGSGLESVGLAFRISGVPAANVATALGTHYQGRRCRLWLAPLTAGHVVIPDPALVFWGRLDTMDIELGQTATLSVSAESRLAAWDRPNVRRYNHEDQQIDYPGDKFFEFVPQMVDRLLVWGS